MDYSAYYRYVDESSINQELKCTVCSSPFSDPVCLQCDHIFCRKCITQWISRGGSNCPACRRQVLRRRHLTPANRPLRNMVNELQVICTLCQQSGIKREDFPIHINQHCPKFTVSCPAKDISCPWTGLRQQLDAHKRGCVFVPFLSILKQLQNQIETQNRRINELETEIKRRNTQTEQSINNLNSKCMPFI